MRNYSPRVEKSYPALDAIEGLHAGEGGTHPLRQLLNLHQLLPRRKGLGLQRRHMDLFEALQGHAHCHFKCTVVTFNFKKRGGGGGGGEGVRARNRSITVKAAVGQ